MAGGTTKVKKKRGLSKQSAFLAAYRLTGSITLAAKAAKVERGLHYRWLEEEAYQFAFESAKEEAAQGLEDEAIRRAHFGVAEPLVYQGQFQFKLRPAKDADGNPVMSGTKRVMEPYGAPLTVQKYSDALMMFLLRGLRPEKYRERISTELSGPAGGPIPVTDKRLEALSDDELAGLLTAARKLSEATE